MQGRLQQVGLSAEIGSIGTDTSHTDAEGIERLSQRTEEHAPIHLAEIRLEQELDTLAGIRQQTSCHHDDEQEDEEDRHHDLGCLLDTTSHTMDNHEVAYQEDSHRPHHRAHWVGRELLEIVRHKGWVAMQLAHDASIHILQAPSRHDSIVARDQEAREHLQVAHPLPSLAIREFGIGTSRIGSTMTADDKFRNHTRDAQQEYASDIHDDEGSATFLTCHIREAPYIAQSYGTTCCSKYQSYLATKTTSICFCHFLYFLFIRVQNYKIFRT